LLTMTQSLYACMCLLDLEYDMRNATILFGLWLASTVLVQIRFWVAILFLALALVEVLIHRKRITVFSSFKYTLTRTVTKPKE